MLTLNDGRSELWQWDTGRKLTVSSDCSQVHFSNKVFGRSIDVDVIDGVATIPDILLQTDKDLTAWAFVGTAESGYTKIGKVFKVNKRNKPADYVFTPSEQTTLVEILDRIEDLENRPSGDVSKEDIQDAVNEYLDNNPVSVDEKDPTVPDWAKQPQKPTYTAADVGALPDTTKIPSTAEDVGALPANAFIPKTAADVGAIPVPETATVGQTIVVKEVDGDGKPVAWECVDVPAGGSDEEQWELIVEKYTVEEEVASVTFNKDVNGNAFSLKKMRIFMYLPSTTDSTTYADYKINGEGRYTAPSGGWSDKNLMCDIEMTGAANTADIRWYVVKWETPQAGTPEWVHIVWRMDRLDTIRSFKWALFSRNVMPDTTFEIWGVRA